MSPVPPRDRDALRGLPGTRLLYEDRLAPITTTLAFIEVPIRQAVQAFLDWQRPIHAGRAVGMAERPIAGDLQAMLGALLPLTSVQRLRHLFVPTRSRWTAYFDNGHQGTDAFSAMSMLAELCGCRGIRAVAVADSMVGETGGASGRHGALMFELYGPRPYPNQERTIALANDGGRWTFHQSGSPLPGERQPAAGVARGRARFTFDDLSGLLGSLDIDAFSPDWYRGVEGEPATLISKIGPVAAELREFTLAEARARH